MPKNLLLTHSKGSRIYILFDGRAKGGDTDAAQVLVSASTRREAEGYIGMFGFDSIWYGYTFDEKGVAIEDGLTGWPV
jgi:hypothetical protein